MQITESTVITKNVHSCWIASKWPQVFFFVYQFDPLMVLWQSWTLVRGYLWQFYVGPERTHAPQFLALHPQFGTIMQYLLSLWIILVHFVVSIEMIENPKFHCTRTGDAWWNFHVWKFHTFMGYLIGMRSLDHKNFGALHPQCWTARTATGGYCPLVPPGYAYGQCHVQRKNIRSTGADEARGAETV